VATGKYIKATQIATTILLIVQCFQRPLPNPNLVEWKLEEKLRNIFAKVLLCSL
jgi:hypothetical protein